MNFTEIKDVISAVCKKHGVEEFEIFYVVGEDISAETLLLTDIWDIPQAAALMRTSLKIWSSAPPVMQE